MGSVQFQIVPCSSLYFFSRSIGLFQCLVNANYKVLICCTCHCQSRFPFLSSSSSSSFFFFLASSVCRSLQCLISALTQGGKGGHLFGLTCSVVLWGGRNTGNKYHWRVWGVLAVYGPHWVWPCSGHVCFSRVHCSGSRWLCRGTVQSGPWVSCNSQAQAAQVQVLRYPQWHRLSWVCILCPVLSSSGDQVLGECTVPGGRCVLITSSVPASWFPGCAVGTLSQVCCMSLLGS